MKERKKNYCFTAIVGQDDMKTALILNAVNPDLGGVLIRGEKGTAKSTAVRALAELLPFIKKTEDCRFGCDPDDESQMCTSCLEKAGSGVKAKYRLSRTEVVDLPINATEDRVAGTLDMEYAVKTGEKRFEAGILADANRSILYVDEVNLLDDHIVDILLDSAAMGVNTVEREGVSFTHPAKFIMVGTMNPEEGDLRPQLIDRFGLSVNVSGERDTEKRIAVLERRLLYDNDPEAFFTQFEQAQNELRDRIKNTQQLLSSVTYDKQILEKIAGICIALEVDGHRADISMLKTAMTLAAFDSRTETAHEDVVKAAGFVLPHRMRRMPFEDMSFDISMIENIK